MVTWSALFLLLQIPSIFAGNLRPLREDLRARDEAEELSQKTNLPKIDFKGRSHFPLDNINQLLKTPEENRNRWNKSPSVERATVTAAACSSTVQSLSVALGDSAMFTSPSYPSNYPNRANCGWEFTTDAANEFQFSCDSVGILRSDYLTVKDGSGSQIARYTSRTTAITAFSTTATTLKVTFTSDKKRGSKGFRCYAKAIAGPAFESNCLCGQKANSRIVGGQVADENEYPWQVGMVSRTTTGWFVFCGGTLISSEWIVTAAHCLSISNVVIGEYNQGVTESYTEVKSVLQTIKHASYNSANYDYDIALLRIAPIDFSAKTNIRPICLPDDTSETYLGQTATITGWGTTSSGGSTSSILREVDVPVISNTQCSSMYGTTPITARMLCAGAPEGGKDSCQGDSGGPLIVADGQNYELAGVVSWGYGCAQAQYPGVYTRVTTLKSWIVQNTRTYGCPRA